MFRIVGMGELLWDILPTGPQLGGAPANFTCHAQSLGANATIISRVGSDQLGRQAISELTQRHIHMDCVEVDRSHPTGTVSVSLNESGIPEFVIHEGVAWDHLILTEPAINAVESADAVCFGSLCQRSEVSRHTIRQLVSKSEKNALRIFDINLRQNYYSLEIIESSFNLANVLKINDDELPVVARLLNLPEGAIAQLETLAQRFALKTIALTRGSQGSILYCNGEWVDHDGFSTVVADTIGAGDSFTAAMTLGLLKGWDLARINEKANLIAAYVCSQRGATPMIPENLVSDFRIE